MKEKIDSFKMKTCATGDAEIREYLFQHKKVYSFNNGCIVLDGSIKIFGADCAYLGYIGGSANNVFINSEHFKTAKFLRVVWKDTLKN